MSKLRFAMLGVGWTVATFKHLAEAGAAGRRSRLTVIARGGNA